MDFKTSKDIEFNLDSKKIIIDIKSNQALVNLKSKGQKMIDNGKKIEKLKDAEDIDKINEMSKILDETFDTFCNKEDAEYIKEKCEDDILLKMSIARYISGEISKKLSVLNNKKLKEYINA